MKKQNYYFHIQNKEQLNLVVKILQKTGENMSKGFWFVPSSSGCYLIYDEDYEKWLIVEEDFWCNTKN